MTAVALRAGELSVPQAAEITPTTPSATGGATAVVVSGGAGTVRFAVQDSGPGVPNTNGG